jgi:hypothetical protein
VKKLTKLLIAVKKQERDKKKRERELDDEDVSSVAQLVEQTIKSSEGEKEAIFVG